MIFAADVSDKFPSKDQRNDRREREQGMNNTQDEEELFTEVSLKDTSGKKKKNKIKRIFIG